MSTTAIAPTCMKRVASEPDSDLTLRASGDGMCRMTATLAAIVKSAGCHGNEPTAISAGEQCQLEDTEVAGGMGSAAGEKRPHVTPPPPAGADDELANTAVRIGVSCGVQRCKSLVDVIVSCDRDAYAISLERVPEWSDTLALLVRPRAESGMVHVGDGAVAGMRREVRAQPAELLRGVRDRRGCVERKHVPSAEVVTVVSARRRGSRAEVLEVRCRALAVIVVVAGHRARTREVATPRGRVALLKGKRMSLGHVRRITRDEHRAADRIENARRGVVASGLTIRDVSGADQNGQRIVAHGECLPICVAALPARCQAEQQQRESSTPHGDGSLHGPRSRWYSLSGSWTMTGPRARSSHRMSNSMSPASIAVQPAVVDDGPPQMWRKMHEPRPRAGGAAL